MADLWQFQSVLNRGEIDPQAIGRIDLQQYYQGLAEAKNVLATPQGGVKKRPGTQHIGESLFDGRLENFSFNVEQSYLLVFSTNRMQVYKDDVLQTNLNGSGLDYVVTPWGGAESFEFDYIQSADTAIITHESVQTHTITRTSDTNWAVAPITFNNIPQYDFNDGLSPTPVDEIQRITFASATDGDRFKLGLEGILTDEIVYTSTVTGQAGLANTIRDELLLLPNTANSGISVAVISATVYEITFSGANADDWDEITGTAIRSVNSAFNITGSTIQNGTTREEDTWSATRGWPRTCTFHEGRLWLGGSLSRPQTLWGSFVGDFFNFFSKKGLDDESIEITLDTDQLNSIEALFSNRSLQIFTSGGEFYIPASPITPENVAVNPQSNLGSKRVRPVTVDGVTLFAQRTGKAIIQFVFVDEFQANQSRSVSILAPHLIQNPQKLATKRGSESSDANYVYILNQNGSLTVFNTLSSEDVAGFTRWEVESEGSDIVSIAVVNNSLYLMVKYFINSQFVYHIVKENPLLNTDNATYETGPNITSVTGLDYLEGETVKVRADGAVRDDAVVTSGDVTIDPPAGIVEIGMEYYPVVTTLPLNVNLQNGPNASQKKRIARVSLQLYESNGVIVNGERIADRTIGVDQFSSPIPKTGIERIYLNGWSVEAQVTVTQDTPMFMTLLNIGMEVAI